MFSYFEMDSIDSIQFNEKIISMDYQLSFASQPGR